VFDVKLDRLALFTAADFVEVHDVPVAEARQVFEIPISAGASGYEYHVIVGLDFFLRYEEFF
jgi:hypothetical protein